MDSEKFTPFAKAAMLIHRPVDEVFEAFINPDITTKFWFTKSSGPLEEGKQVEWEWEMYDFKVQVDVKSIEPGKRIVIDWTAFGTPTIVEWVFTPRNNNDTFVSVKNYGFIGDEVAIIKQAIGSSERFALVLSAMKALLEHGIRLTLVADRFPEGLNVPGKY